MLAPKIYSLMSIGPRGVGKTVFLIGSYLELHTEPRSKRKTPLWFDCEDHEAEENISKIISYVARTGHYPPGTMRLTNFDFSLKQRNWWKNDKLCNFRLWDVPGESCHLSNPAFISMVLNSHGCCVFIDAHALILGDNPENVLKEIFDPIKSIAELASKNNLAHPFALILTKCDLLVSQPNYWQDLEKCIQPIISYLEDLGIKYQTFCSEIPIVSTSGVATLKARNAAPAILWLINEVRQTYHPHPHTPELKHSQEAKQIFNLDLKNLYKYVIFVFLIFAVGVGWLGVKTIYNQQGSGTQQEQLE